MKMKQSYKNILIAVDGSEGADYALNRAINIAQKNQATLHFVHIIEHFYYPGDTGSIQASQEKAGNELLDKYRESVRNSGLQDVKTILKSGNPKSVIPKIAKEINADLIVSGATGLNAIEKILGSLSESIARSAHCDVLIVRKQTER